MIREKQRTEIARRFAAALKTGQVAPPDLATHVMLALASGESPRLKPAAEIVKAARLRIVKNRYSDREHLGFVEVFASTNGYDAEMKAFMQYEAGRQKLLKPLKRLADRLALIAMSNDESVTAESLIEQFDEAFDASGIERWCAENRPGYTVDADGED